jgi:hypothetical protein
VAASTSKPQDDTATQSSSRDTRIASRIAINDDISSQRLQSDLLLNIYSVPSSPRQLPRGRPPPLLVDRLQGPVYTCPIRPTTVSPRIVSHHFHSLFVRISKYRTSTQYLEDEFRLAGQAMRECLGAKNIKSRIKFSYTVSL